MSRKVYMSVLGTGIYNECKYEGRKSSTSTRFVQEATLNDVGAMAWNEDDAVFILLTKNARELNWKREICERKGQPYTGLESVLNNMHLGCAVKDVDIPDGKNSDEMWGVFNRVYDLIRDGDELYLDLTHAFRYLPMLLMIMGNYAKFLKKSKIVYMSYGNYEARVERTENSAPEAPIVDLLPLVEIQSWTDSASSFNEMGRVEPLSRLMQDILLKTNDKKFRGHLTILQKNLMDFQQQIETCCGKQICSGEVASEILIYIDRVLKNEAFPVAAKPMLYSIRELVSPFASKSIDNIRSAILWCQKFGLVQQGYTLCQEGLITVVCDKLSAINPYSGKDAEKRYREYWGAILGINTQDLSNRLSWKSILKENQDLTVSIFELPWVRQMRQTYVKVTQKRNFVNHGGFIGDIRASEIKKKFETLANDCLEFFDMTLALPEKGPSRKGMFINFSNHPFEQWSEKQLAQARLYGELQEFPFPEVNPAWDEIEMSGVVEEFFQKIKSYSLDYDVTVHIMGEMTFVFALINKLRGAGINCIASTTCRNSVMNVDGGKTSFFEFVRFRSYE